MLSKVLFAIPAVYSVLLLSWHLLRRHLLAKNNGLPDLPLLQNSRHPDEKIPGTAVICGGSIAGLLAARVCHDHFERVLIVEPEAWVASEEGRKIDGWNRKHQRSRVVQYTSLHACQSFLLEGLKSLFPDFLDECLRSNIKVRPANARFNLSGVEIRVPFSAFKSGLPQTLYLTRSGFETLLRRLVLDKSLYPNIELLTGTVTDVRPDPANHSQLNSVVVKTESGEQEFPAVLVADCTGPARAGMRWLENHGYGISTTYPNGKLPLNQLKISLDQKLRYSSMLFRPAPEFHDRLPIPAALKHAGPLYTYLEDGVEQGRCLFALTQPDGDQFMTFVGHHGKIRSQPKDLAELKVYVQGLNTMRPIPEWVLQLLDMLEEIEESAVICNLRVAPTFYVRYHQATNLPSNWIALGDSVMTLNPLFSEGCTKAFRGALAIHNVLRRALPTSGNTLPSDFSTRFFTEQYDKIDLAWQNTRLLDYGVPTTEPIPGESLSSGSYLRWYITQLQRLSIVDDHAALVVYNSSMSLGSAIDAFHPNLVLKILWRACVG